MQINWFEIFMYFVGVLVTIIGFLLAQFYKEFKQTKKELVEQAIQFVEDSGKLKGQIELVHLEQKMKFQEVEKSTQLEIKNLAENVNKLTDSVNELIHLKFK